MSYFSKLCESSADLKDKWKRLRNTALEIKVTAAAMECDQRISEWEGKYFSKWAYFFLLDSEGIIHSGGKVALATVDTFTLFVFHHCLLHCPVFILVLILLTSWLPVLLLLVTLYAWCVQSFLYNWFQFLTYLNSVLALISIPSQIPTSEFQSD